MKVIGLTGGTGSGKSAVSTVVLKEGAYVVDADRIAHAIIKKDAQAYREIIEFFGTSILDDSKEIIRKKLGEIVFQDQEKLSFLNQCTHKYIKREIEARVQHAQEEGTARCIIIDAPLLMEAGLEVLCDEIWVVYGEEEVRARRVMARDDITYEAAKKRISTQKSWEDYASYAHHIIDNSKDMAWLKTQVLQLMRDL